MPVLDRVFMDEFVDFKRRHAGLDEIANVIEQLALKRPAARMLLRPASVSCNLRGC